jgi:hypothetical protein
MIALNIPMQPSSNTPMSALRRRRSAASSTATCSSGFGMRTAAIGTT